jgi:uncharacterized protein (DUF3084 family)
MKCKECSDKHDQIRILQDENAKIQEELKASQDSEKLHKEEWTKCHVELEAVKQASVDQMEELRIANDMIASYQKQLSDLYYRFNRCVAEKK